MKKISLLAFLLLVFISIGCKKTAEGEQKNWDANVQEVKQLEGQYPGFKPALEARISEAQTMWDAAIQVSNEEERIQKMADANSSLMSGLVSDLKKVDQEIKDLQKGMNEISAKSTQEQQTSVTTAVNQGNTTLTSVNAMLATGAGTPMEAEGLLKKVLNDLKFAQEQVAAIQQLLAPKQDTTKKQTEVQPIKCEYCGSSNPADALKCKSCGADLPHGKK